MWDGSLGSGRFPGGGNGNPLQYSCPENPMDRRVWQATVHRVTELDMTEVTQHTCAESSNESKDFPGGSDSEESACNEGDLGSIPGWENPLEEGIAIHSSILAWRIPMDRRAWQGIIHGVAMSRHY